MKPVCVWISSTLQEQQEIGGSVVMIWHADMVTVYLSKQYVKTLVPVLS